MSVTVSVIVRVWWWEVYADAEVYLCSNDVETLTTAWCKQLFFSDA